MEFNLQDSLIDYCILTGSEQLKDMKGSSFDIYRIGKPISRGCYKEAYEDESNPAQVLLITDDVSQLNEEFSCLKKLQRIGLRTPKIYERYDFPFPTYRISILVVEKLEHVEIKDVYNVRSDFITDVLFSLELLWENKIYIDDLQLMKNLSGEPVFIDPLEITPMNQDDVDNLDVEVSARNRDSGCNLFRLNLSDMDGVLDRLWNKEYLMDNLIYRY